MKACESSESESKEEHRVNIGRHHKEIPVWRRAIGLTLVYLPILTWPFVITSALLSYYHLKMVGAKNLKTLFDFLPERASHRYKLKEQITMDGTFSLSLARRRL